MKTITIKTLKKELLVIELPTAETKISIGLHCIGIKPPPIGKDASDINGYYHIYTEMFHGFKLLGSPDEIKEEDVKDLVEKITTRQYKNYGYVPHYFQYLLSTAIESFNSALEKEILWENPHGKEEPNKSYFLDDKGSFLRQEKKQWHKAQEKTFDKKRTLIFFKN